MPRFVCAAVVLAVTAPAHSQERDSAPLALDLGASTRALALGNAYVLGDRVHDAIFYNPALLRNARGAGAALQRYGSQGTHGSVSALTAWSGGGLGLGVQFLTYALPTATLDDLPRSEADLLTAGPVGGSEIVGTIAHGRELFGVDLGVAFKVSDVRIGGLRDATAAVDLGVATEWRGVWFGLAVQNLGPGIGISDTNRSLPNRVTFGATLPSRPLGPVDIVTTAGVTRREDGQVVPGGGVEFSWWPIAGRTFTARLGVQRIPDGRSSPVTLGAAFTGDELTIEYAYQEIDGSGAAHRVGIRWR